MGSLCLIVGLGAESWTMIRIAMSSDRFRFSGHLLPEAAPETCKWFLARLPYTVLLIQAAWSGKAVFGSLQNAGKDLPAENAKDAPPVGTMVIYPGNPQGNAGELYIPYGENRFAFALGRIAGNHFLTIDEGAEQLPEFGRVVRFEGAKEMTFALQT